MDNQELKEYLEAFKSHDNEKYQGVSKQLTEMNEILKDLTKTIFSIREEIVRLSVTQAKTEKDLIDFKEAEKSYGRQEAKRIDKLEKDGKASLDKLELDTSKRLDYLDKEIKKKNALDWRRITIDVAIIGMLFGAMKYLTNKGS